MIDVKIIADSINTANGYRITTALWTYPRFIHSEVMTHRVFSRNAASSRAIPVERMIRAVEENPAMPLVWTTAQKGMQGGPPLEGDDAAYAEATWRAAMCEAVARARDLLSRGVHKQVANRLLEPFAHITTLVTATEWGNFFALRAHPAAEPTFESLARMMLDAYRSSEPTPLEPGAWHLPFGEKMRPDVPIEERLKVCTARCARTSYVSFDGDFTPEQDMDLHDRLAASGHWSPFEHAAQAMGAVTVGGVSDQSGNFRGWKQYRKSFPNENQTHPAIQ